MQQDILNHIKSDVENFLAKEQKNMEKINKLEKEMHKMRNYISRPDNVKIENEEEQKAINAFIRRGEHNSLITKSFSGAAEEGGVMITPTLSTKIISMINQKSVMRQIASIEKISTRSLDLIYEDGNFASGWVAETDQRDATDTPRLLKKTINTHEIFAQPKATQGLIDDAEINIEHWLAERISNNFTRLENQAFILGDGNNKPNGLLVNDQIEKVDVGNKISTEMLLGLIGTLDEGYLSNASFIMNRKTLSVVQGLKDETGRFIWSQSLSDPLQQAIFGIPVIISSHMPDIGNTNLAIAIGDFKEGYKIVDRSGINLMRDPYTDKPYVKFYAVKRVGGDVVNPNAIKFAEFSE